MKTKLPHLYVLSSVLGFKFGFIENLGLFFRQFLHVGEMSREASPVVVKADFSGRGGGGLTRGGGGGGVKVTRAGIINETFFLFCIIDTIVNSKNVFVT